MKINRRAVLSGIGALGGASVAASAASLSEDRSASDGRKGPPKLVTLPKDVPYLTGPLINRTRASKILDELGFDGLVLTDPISVYWLTGFDSPTFARRLSADGLGLIAIVSKDERQPISVIMNSFAYYWEYANIHNDPNEVVVYQYTQPPPESVMGGYIDGAINSAILSTAKGPVSAGQPIIFEDRGQAPLSQMELRSAKMVRKQSDERPVGKSSVAVLRRALREMKLDRGRVGVDVSENGPAWAAIKDASPSIDLASSSIATSLIRLVKSPAEISLMRRASQSNAEAANAACKAVRAGATYRDLRTTFFSEASKRGNVPVWIIIDGMRSETFDASFRDGQGFLIDAVSSCGSYYGDYGRTVFVGEPAKSLAKHTDAISFAWNAIRERLQPGLRFSEIQAMGVESLRKGGFDTAVRFTPHSIGLFHTDCRGVGDITLEKGMIISVDCPVLDAGIGGSAHLEDLTLITADGHEMINDIGDQVIIV